MRHSHSERLRDFTDSAALAEARRIAMVVLAKRADRNAWFGFEERDLPVFNEESAFVMGMLAMFRYARGEAVPALLVQDFLDRFLPLMFCGLASGNMALPPFRRMSDRPWALAWRAAELRLAFESEEGYELSALAHLLEMSPEDLSQALYRHGYQNATVVPKELLKELFESAKSHYRLQDLLSPPNDEKP